MKHEAASEARSNQPERKVLLLGRGIGKSISPAILQRAFAEVGFTATYELLDVEAPGFETTLKEIRASREIIGFNVTIPYKEKILPSLQVFDEQAKMVGAVNTVKLDAERNMTGFNTDVNGIDASLSKLGLTGQRGGRSAVILGAGGAARACIYATLQNGFDRIMILNRSFSRASALAAEFASKFPERKIESAELSRENFHDFVDADCVLLINAIPPYETLSSVSALETVPASMKYFELSYLGGSFLMKSAEDRGLEAIDGLLMLVEQAAKSFEIWTGISAPRRAMMLEAQSRVSGHSRQDGALA